MGTWTALGGAVSSGVLDAVLEAKADEWFPQYANQPLFGVEPLPPVDDWAVLAVSVAPYLAGKYAPMKNSTAKKVTQFGEGMLLYSIAMIIHHMMVRASWMTPQQAGYRRMAEYVPVKINVPG